MIIIFSATAFFLMIFLGLALNGFTLSIGSVNYDNSRLVSRVQASSEMLPENSNLALNQEQLIFSLPALFNPISSRPPDSLGSQIRYGTGLARAEIKQGRPVRLKIPSINVDSSFEYVGLTPQGAVGAPKDFSKVAWFDLWPRPGENGTAIISGHFGIKNNQPSVFDNLHKLRPGDKLSVEDDQGIITTFVVRESRRYDPTAQAPEVFSSTDNNSHLNLITCEGVWDEVSKSYSKRLVVFTDKE